VDTQALQPRCIVHAVMALHRLRYSATVAKDAVSAAEAVAAHRSGTLLLK